jgi:hypothetical protein
MRLGRDGFFHVMLSLVCAITVITGLMLWGLLHQWKNLMDTQLRLDKCTGQLAVDFKHKLETVKEMNYVMIATRASISAAMASVYGEATVPALQAVLTAEYSLQELQQVEWDAQAVKWLATGGCGKNGDIAIPVLPLNWSRPPPDNIGENAISLDSLPKQVRIEAYHLPRKSAAILERSDDESWSTYWTTPLGTFSAGT